MTNPDDPNSDPSLDAAPPLGEGGDEPFPEASADWDSSPKESAEELVSGTSDSAPADEAFPDEPSPPLRAPAVATVTGRAPAALPAPPSRLDLLDRQEPLFRDFGGYRLRLEPADLARLRELPGSRGKSDDEIGETFFDGQAERIAASVAGDVPSGAELRVVVDPYSRQAFVALENQIRGILSF